MKVILLALLIVACQGCCINPTSEVEINNAFQVGGEGTIVSLCPNAIINVFNPIRFTAANQELSTDTYPTGASRALIIINGVDQAVAVEALFNGNKVRNLQFDGNRKNLGFLYYGDALIELGGPVINQLIDNVKVFDSRSWSCVHVLEGNGLGPCVGAQITNSQFGHSGTPEDWTDGISYACTNGLIKGNTIIDASNNGITLYTPVGTLVTENTIVASNTILNAGITLVDYGPDSGNYRSVVVSDNIINAEGALIKVAIAAGPVVWSEYYGAISVDGTINNNIITGDHLGYGIAVSGVSNFTIQNNVAINYNQVGVVGSNCLDPTMTPPTVPFVYDTTYTSSSSLQSDFVAGNVHDSICIE